jgi:hypothetical protein
VKIGRLKLCDMAGCKILRMGERAAERLRLFLKWCGMAAAVSCVMLFVILGVLWVVTWRNYRQVSVATVEADYSVSMFAGVVFLGRMQRLELVITSNAEEESATAEFMPRKRTGNPGWAVSYKTGASNKWPLSNALWESGGWGYVDVPPDSITQMTAYGGRAFAVPVYFLELLLIGAGVGFWGLFRSNRWAGAHCQACGLNLGGDAAAAHCPACGAAKAPGLLGTRSLRGWGARAGQLAGRYLVKGARMGAPLLALLVVLLWIRGYWVCESYGVEWARDYMVVSHRGVFYFERRVWYRNPSEADPAKLVEEAHTPWLGVHYEAAPVDFCSYPPQVPLSYFRVYDTEPLFIKGGSSYKVRAVPVPAWLVAGVFGLGVVAVVLGRRKRWPAGHCQGCGYDLGGNPGAEICPECGVAVGGKRAAGKPGVGV